MNVLEHYVVKVFEERPLTEEESKEALKYKMNPEKFIVVSWEYNCYGDHRTIEEIILKSRWEEIKRRGYDLR